MKWTKKQARTKRHHNVKDLVGRELNLTYRPSKKNLLVLL